MFGLPASWHFIISSHRHDIMPPLFNQTHLFQHFNRNAMIVYAIRNGIGKPVPVTRNSRNRLPQKARFARFQGVSSAAPMIAESLGIVEIPRLCGICVAEQERFELSVGCPTRHFQCRALDRTRRLLHLLVFFVKLRVAAHSDCLAYL